MNVSTDFFDVGQLIRPEAKNLIVGYSFDLQNNSMVSKKVPNANKQYTFHAWILNGSTTTPVKVLNIQARSFEFEDAENEAEE